MDAILIPVVCAAFGAVCARYVTALGLLLSAAATFGFLLFLDLIAGGIYSASFLISGFIAIEIGYLLGVIGLAFASRFPVSGKPQERSVDISEEGGN